jgi:hypothetical protein
MAIPVYLNDTTYYGREVDTPGDVIKRGMFNTQELTDLGFTVREDVVVPEKMYMATMQDGITRKRTGCGEKTNSGAFIAREKLLSTVNLQIWDEICAEDFGGTFWELFRKKGYDVNNLENTPMNDLIMELYMNVGKRDLLSIAQFGDTSIALPAAVANPGPDGTPAQKAAYSAYKQAATLRNMDGFWKLVFGGVAARGTDAGDPDGIIRAVNIDQAAPLAANYTRDVLLPGLYNGQSDLMDEVDDAEKTIVLSRELYTNLEASLRTFTVAGERAYDLYRNGTGDLMFNGIKVVKNKLIEQKALTPYAAGDPRTFKRRAYLIVNGGFQVGTDTYQDSQKYESWYSRDTDLNNIRMRYRLGIQYMDGDVVVVAY